MTFPVNPLTSMGPKVVVVRDSGSGSYLALKWVVVDLPLGQRQEKLNNSSYDAVASTIVITLFLACSKN